jgi:hypothetical protein
MKNNNPYDEKYSDPNIYFSSMMNEIKYRLSKLELDLVHINDTELKGVAQKMYTDLSIKYFELLKDDLTLQKMYEDLDYEDGEDYE